MNRSNVSSNSQDESFDERYSLVRYNRSPSTTPVGRDTKPGWYDTHERHVEFAKTKFPSIVICGDSIVAGLSRYPRVWGKYFKPRQALNCGIGGDQTQHVLWRMENISLPTSVHYVVIHCGTNNIDRDSPQDIANGIISVGLVLQEDNLNIHVVVTGLIPRDYDGSSYRRRKIKEVNKYLQRHCKEFPRFTYMKQDHDWIFEDGSLNEKYYYTDHLHLIEAGNEKLATSITNIIDKIECREEMCYSSDEEKSAYKFERKHGVRRKDTPNKRDMMVESPLKLNRGSSERNQRKRSLSPCRSDLDELSSSSQKRLRRESTTNNDDNEEDDRYLRRNLLRSIDKPTIVSSCNDRQHTKDIRNTEDNTLLSPSGIGKLTSTSSSSQGEYHGSFSITKELKHDKLDGTAKTIDISKTDKERLAARRAKFGALPIGSGTTSLKKLSDSSKAEVRSDEEPIKHIVSLTKKQVQDVIESLGE